MSAAGRPHAPPVALAARRSGVLLHPTALPGLRGALGASARALIDWLAAAGFSVWQVLPLGPVGKEGSPYWVRSDMAGNTALIDRSEVPQREHERADFERFCHTNAYWLEDYALFEVLSVQHAGAPWWEWPAPLRDREPAALVQARTAQATALDHERHEQWIFAHQWAQLRAYAQARGVLLFGDLPIYVAPDSVATWSQPAQFELTGEGRPAALSGVPPDYFAEDGQLWGNPLYRWAQAERDGFAFWRARLAAQIRRFDLVRIDHFRGLAGYWSVPAGAKTAREGHWRLAPGHELLRVLERDLHGLPLVAEDLGVITPDVTELRERFGLPGMRVLQFGFDGHATNPHLPHNLVRNELVYTGTHDNDTTLGWYRSLDAESEARVNLYLGCTSADMPMGLVRAALASVAQLAIVPVQDLLALGSEARFNIPGTAQGNWQWRMAAGALDETLARRYRTLNQLYGRHSAEGQ
ncbi:MAG: 4-alpha-glucanotransferase [Steroidobacteraceae bacterium]|jgi:4-alpha-glucanotransferase